ncbi:HlyD family secretion protein [Brevundimonas nasdae]|uniref:HlyD family secretion protein n=1 Tax=Brevundimonas nasdae TaxID=172043 RepID=UPI003F691645
MEIKTPHAGYLAAIDVKQGDAIVQHQPLFTVDQRTFREGGLDAGASMIAEGEALEMATQSAASERAIRIEAAARNVAAAQTTLDLLSRELNLQTQREHLGAGRLEKLRPLVQQGFMSDLEFLRRQEDILAQQQQRIGLERQIADQRARLRQAHDDLAASRVAARTAESEDRMKRELLQQRRVDATGATTVRPLSTIDGKVVSIDGAIGEFLPAQATVITLARRDDPLLIESLVPIRWSGGLEVGQQVFLKVEGSLEDRISVGRGVIVEIDRVPVAPNPQASPLPIHQPSYRVRVRPAGDAPHTLNIGQTLSVSLGTKKRSFFDLLFHP